MSMTLTMIPTLTEYFDLSPEALKTQIQTISFPVRLEFSEFKKEN